MRRDQNPVRSVCAVSGEAHGNSAARRGNRAAIPRGRRMLDINRLQCVDHVSSATFVAGARAFAGYVQVYDQPAMKGSRLQYPMASWNVYVPIAEVEDVFEE